MENLTPKQVFVYKIVSANFDEAGSCTVNIHGDLAYPRTPDSINPAVRDVQALLDAELIGGFTRVSSRTIKINNI